MNVAPGALAALALAVVATAHAGDDDRSGRRALPA
jgi:hypothetical protein